MVTCLDPVCNQGRLSTQRRDDLDGLLVALRERDDVTRDFFAVDDEGLHALGFSLRVFDLDIVSDAAVLALD